MKTHPCDQCGKVLTLGPNHPPVGPGSNLWCSDACANAWFAADPKRSEGWVSVRDLSPMQRAELDAMLGHGAKA